MRKLIYILLFAFTLLACERRELTYTYNPTVSLVIIPSWENLSERPDLATVYCYPDDDSSPVIKQTGDIDSIVVNLPVGNYRILLFNEIISDFYTIGFTGMSTYETAEVYAAATTSKWYASKLDEDNLVYEPAEFVASTYHTVEVTQNDIQEILGLRTIDEYVEIPAHEVLYLTPQKITKTARITVEVDQIHNLYSARASLNGMASGYYFASQTSHTNYATHLMESTTWSINYDTDPTQGEITTTFRSFGMPDTETATRAFDLATWGGLMYLETLLVDQDLDNIQEYQFTLADKTTINGSGSDTVIDDDSELAKGDTDEAKSETGFNDDTDTDVDVDVDVDIDIDIEIRINISLPDAEPVGSSGSGFDANITDWEDEQNVEIPI